MHIIHCMKLTKYLFQVLWLANIVVFGTNPSAGIKHPYMLVQLEQIYFKWLSLYVRQNKE